MMTKEMFIKNLIKLNINYKDGGDDSLVVDLTEFEDGEKYYIVGFSQGFEFVELGMFDENDGVQHLEYVCITELFEELCYLANKKSFDMAHNAKNSPSNNSLN